jgi:FMNH2-dependent dimethyl sulfone monooxygenase
MHDPQELRRATNPLFNDRKLKLGTFCTNLNGGCAISTMPETLEDHLAEYGAARADRRRDGIRGAGAGRALEGLWRRHQLQRRRLRVLSWAAGIGAATKYSAVFSTSHITMYHPTLAAKQATVIDHISNGRHAINIVGWMESGRARYVRRAHAGSRSDRYANGRRVDRNHDRSCGPARTISPTRENFIR